MRVPKPETNILSLASATGNATWEIPDLIEIVTGNACIARIVIVADSGIEIR